MAPAGKAAASGWWAGLIHRGAGRRPQQAGVDDVDATVRVLARIVVARVAPQELAMFDAMWQVHALGPGRRRAAGSDPLGFGTSDVVVLLTPVVLIAVSEAIRYLLVDVLVPVVGRGGVAAVRAVRRLFAVGSAEGNSADVEADDPALELTTAQWDELRGIVVDVSRRAGLAEDTARLLGDAVVGAGQAPRSLDTP